MRQKDIDNLGDKVGPEFRDRLAHLSGKALVHAVLLVQQAAAGNGGGRRTRGSTRAALVEAGKRSAAEGLGEIDAILKKTGGHRLADAPDLLGSLPIETTAEGIVALAGSPRVKAILEDQQIKAI